MAGYTFDSTMPRFHSFALFAFCLSCLSGCDGRIGRYPGGYDASVPPVVDAAVPPAVDAANAPDAQPPAPDATAAVPCVEGDDNLVDPDTGNCYMLFTALVDWEVAEGQCADIGAHLVDMTSANENQLVLGLAGDDFTWTGANDRAFEGDWVWLSGDSLGYVNWRMGEPNNSTSSDMVNGEDCMVLEGNQGTWDDRPCTLRFYQFVCEREL